MSKGHYVCDICGEYIRPKRRNESTGQKVVNHIPIIESKSDGTYRVVGHTKAHSKCLRKLKKR